MSGARQVMAPNNPRDKPRPGDRVKSPLGYGRETVESVVVAFTLALLFRAFEAEAFVIPTGSMAPTLMGRHKDLICESCDRDYRVGCSAEEDDQSQSLRAEQLSLTAELARLQSVVKSSLSLPQERAEAQRRVEFLESDRGPLAQLRTRLASKMVAASKCPNCGLVMQLMDKQGQRMSYDPRYPSFNGDRILVNKFIYDFVEPKRWDVVVFKYPEDAKTNYIKRLVGLPNEIVSIVAGDIWTSRNDQPPQIARKPPKKMLAMLQCVHDSHYVSSELSRAGWPLCWSDWSSGAESAASRWTTDDGGRSFAVSTVAPDARATLRYQHFLPTAEDWDRVLHNDQAADDAVGKNVKPTLIDDFQPYNAMATRSHPVGDLAVEMQLKNAGPSGSVVFELVEAGQAHRCTIDLATGEATLDIAALAAGEDRPKARTPVRKEGSWKILFSNIDNELSLFIDGHKVEFDQPTAWSQSIDSALESKPVETKSEPGSNRSSDLSPAGVTAVGASVQVSHLRMLRDIFYIGAHDVGTRQGELIERKRLEFPLEQDQFFMLGDNSAASKDSRLWVEGHHVDRHLLVGKALVIFWPHAIPANWSIPLKIKGSEVRLPSWPNFARMRVVR